MTTPQSRRSFLGRCAAGGLGIVIAGSIDASAGPTSALAADAERRGRNRKLRHERWFHPVNNHEIDGTEPFRVPHLTGLTYDPGEPAGGVVAHLVDLRRPNSASGARSARTTATSSR